MKAVMLPLAQVNEGMRVPMVNGRFLARKLKQNHS